MILVAGLATGCLGQAQEFSLDDEEWTQIASPEPGSDTALMLEARRLIANGQASQARSMLSRWLKTHETSTHPLLAEGYLLRGDALVAVGREFRALYDYETVINDFPADQAFVEALERQLEIGKRYLHGLRRKFLGLRIESAKPLGTELLMRIQERLPGSMLAEEAAIELADFFYREGELELAAQMYDILLRNFPQTRHRRHAMERRIFSNVGQFKGPRYSASGLVEARALIENYRDRFPAEASQSGIGDALVARIDDSAGAQMLSSARWYLRRNDPVSARLMLERLLLKHPNTSAALTALDIMAEREWLPDYMFTDPEGTPPAETRSGRLNLDPFADLTDPETGPETGPGQESQPLPESAPAEPAPPPSTPVLPTPPVGQPESTQNIGQMQPVGGSR